MTTITYSSWTEWVSGTFVSKNSVPTAIDVSRLRAQITSLRKMENSHFLDSENAGTELDAAVEGLEHKLVALETAIKGYPLISLKFLEETDEKSLPLYTVQEVRDRHFEMSVMPRNKNYKNPHRMDWGKSDDRTPDFNQTEFDFFSNTARTLFSGFYKKAIQTLAEISVKQHDWEKIRIISISEGVVYPIKTRSKLEKALKYFDGVYVVYKAPQKWNTTEMVSFSPSCGLLVGVIDSQFFLVDEFTTVKTVDYLAVELKKASVRTKKSK